MRYYWGLDLLRFFAATLVVLFHISVFGANAPSWPVDPASAPLGWLAPAGWLGYIGVQLFFVLSGFIISASAENSTVTTFLKRRAIRVFPALWLSAALAMVARAAWGEPLSDLLPSFLHSIFLMPKGPYIDGVVWSLVVEAAFYACIACVIYVASKWGGMERWLTISAFGIGIASTAFTILKWMAVKTTVFGSAGGLAASLAWFGFDVLLLRHGIFFAVGMLLYQTIERDFSKAITFGLGVFGVACCLQIATGVRVGHSSSAPLLVWIVATCAAYASARYGDRAINPKLRSFMRQVGLMTYPLYLNHFVLGQALMPLFAMWIPNRIDLFLALFGTLLANAAFMATYPERWLQRGARKFLFRDSVEGHKSGSVPRQGRPRVVDVAEATGGS